MRLRIPPIKILLIIVFLAFCQLASPYSFCQERFRNSPPHPDPLPKLNLPELESAILSNGLELSVVRRQNFPFISLRLIILSGESASPEKLPGLATFTANMLNKGTIHRTSSEIAETIESMGGHFLISIHPDYSMLSLTFLEEYLDEALQILSEMILFPEFTRKEIENVKRTLYYDLLGRSSDPEFVARRLMFQVLFQDHAYRKYEYNEDVIKNLNRKDLLVFFDNFYRPNNAKLILVGNLNLPTAARKVSRYFNTWKKNDTGTKRLAAPKPNDKLKICLADIPHCKEATVFLGNVILPEIQEDFFTFLVLNQVLGGSPSSRLFMNLRETKEYAYYAFSSVNFFKTCGIFSMLSKVRPEVISDSVVEMLKEIQKIQKEKIPNFEIEQAKSRLIGHFPLSIQTLDDLSSKVAEIQVFNFEDSQWNKYYENIMYIDSDKVWKAAKKSSIQSPVVIIAGDKNILIDYLKDFEELEIYDSKGIYQYKIARGVEE